MQCMVMYSFSFWYLDNLELNFKFFASEYCVFSVTKTNTVETRDYEDIVNNRSVKAVLSKITGFAGFRNKLIPNLENASIKNIIFVTNELRYSALKVKQGRKTPLELSLFMMRTFTFVKMLKLTLK